ncbi:MAG: hypothetical protein IKW85_05800 [Muribaculaceae bacterium]|nr:hypothetical protein [Muribaculaceae bacterium]
MINTRFTIWLAVAALVLSALFTSCIEDGFTTSSSDVLAFNMDTVAFDTVITLQGTATKQMVVYNHSKKQINISSIKVAGLSQKGHFHLNVDGVRGDEFQNVEIRGNDSIFIFIEAKLDEMEQNEPTLLEDRLEFVANGVSKSVLLSAWGQDVVRIKGDTVMRKGHLTAEKPYLIYDTMFVAPGATLTIDPGATLLFHDKAAMRCAGKMIANGTAEEPITFRGDRLDRIVGETSFDIMSGQWGGIIFTPPTMGNVLKHVVMKGSSIGMHCSANGDTTNCALKLVNCVLTNSASTCLATAACYVEAIGTEFSDAAEEVAYFAGGKVMASQCTFANYYLFSIPSLPIINVFDVEFSNGTIGKIKARFNNCIIHGLSPEINEGKLDNFDVYMNYCLLKSSGYDDSHFINCVWEADPCFLTIRDDYIFDYRIGNESAAIGKGNPALCPEEGRYDRYGYDRFSRGAIDLGAYVWVYIPEEEEE